MGSNKQESVWTPFAIVMGFLLISSLVVGIVLGRLL